jgi:hypothetical protein
MLNMRRVLKRTLYVSLYLALIAECNPLAFASSSLLTLRYVFEPRNEGPKLTLHIILELEGVPPEGATLVLPWGDSNNLLGAVQNVRAESTSVRIVDMADPATKRLFASRQGHARISYDLIKNWDGPLREDVRHLVHLEPNYCRS